MVETHRIHPPGESVGTATLVRHIKLGSGNSWAEDAIATGDLVFGDPDISHDLAREAVRTRDWAAIRDIYRARSKDDGAATRLTGELKDFYTLGPNCLWVTYHRGRLYWAIAAPAISFNANNTPSRRRRTRDGWHCTDANGKALNAFDLSSALTQTRMARGTICQPHAWRQYLALIKAAPSPLIEIARNQEADLRATIVKLIETLDQVDFEVLAQRVAESLGWRITSGIGGVQPDVDFVASLPAVGLQGFFQAKTRSTQSQLDAFVTSMPTGLDNRLVFITQKGERLDRKGRLDLEIWAGEDLARKSMQAGLTAWILERAQ